MEPMEPEPTRPMVNRVLIPCPSGAVPYTINCPKRSAKSCYSCGYEDGYQEGRDDAIDEMAGDYDEPMQDEGME